MEEDWNQFVEPELRRKVPRSIRASEKWISLKPFFSVTPDLMVKAAFYPENREVSDSLWNIVLCVKINFYGLIKCCKTN